MAVAIQGQLYAGVPSKVLDVLRMGSPAKQQLKAGVPQVVPANVRQPRSPEKRLEVSVHDVLGVHRGALRGCENEVVILSRCADLELFL